MAPRHNTLGPTSKPRVTKKGHLPSPIPDLFILAVLEFRCRAPNRFPTNHLSWTSDQIHAFVEIAWEQVGPDRQAYYWNAAGDGLSVKNQSQSTGTKSVANDVCPPPCPSSRTKDRKPPTKSRAKRKALPPPPDVQVRPATPLLPDNLGSTLPLTPDSTCSSISIPLQAVIRSGDPPPFEPGSAPQAPHVDGDLPPHMPPFPTVDFARTDGAASPGPNYPFPFISPGHITRPPPFAIGPASTPTGHAAGIALGIPGSTSSGGTPAPNIDPSLLDAQRQVRDQVYSYYPSMQPSLGYAHMSSAVGHWPWR
ncbi:hypothetical protein V8D89_001169 [Ganoderma adspersum]